MKVVHLLLTGEPGGIEMLAYTIAQNSRNENIMWFLFRGGSVAEQMKASGIPVVIAGTPRYRWRKKIKEFVQYCRQEKVDVVINHMDSPVACAHVMALKRALPEIQIFGYLHNDVRDMTVGLKNRLGYIPFIKAMHRCCDKVFAISEFVKMAGMEAYGLKEEKIAVVYNGVDVERFSVNQETQPHCGTELIFVGRLIREKGVHLLLEAMNRLPAEVNCHATVVGFGSEYENLRSQAESLNLDGRVDFLGKRMDVPQLLQKADWFVHTAICQEGFGITLVEAMAAGKPCIAFNGGGIPEIIDDGANGFLVEMGSVEALVQSILKACAKTGTSAYAQMSALAKRRAGDFRIEDMVNHLEGWYTVREGNENAFCG